MIRHTILRNEIYYFNIRLEGNIFYRKSLKTDSPSKARRLIKKILSFIGRRINVLKTELDEFIEVLIGNKVSNALYATHSTTKPHTERAKVSRNQAIAHSEMNSTPDFQANPNQLEFVKSQLKAVKNTSPLNEHMQVSDAFLEYFDHPTNESKHFDMLHQQLNQYIQSAINTSSVVELKQEIAGLREHFKDYLSDNQKKEHGVIQEQPVPEAEPEIDSPYFKDVRLDFIEWLGLIGKSEGVIEDRDEHYDIFITAMGDKKLHEIDSDYIRGVWKKVLFLPKPQLPIAERYGIEIPEKFTKGNKETREDSNLRKKKRKLYILGEFWKETEIGNLDKDEIAIKDLYSHKIIKKWLTFLKDFFRFAEEKSYRPSLKAVDTLSAQEAKDRKSVRVPLPNKILLNLLEYTTSNRNLDYKNWVVLIMAFSGMRPAEICNLESKHIVRDEDTGIYYFNITKGKTANALRKVPIHSKLLKLGLLDLVPNDINHRIFDFNSTTLSAYFNKLRDILSIPLTSASGDLLSLYSIRHTIFSMFGWLSEEYKFRLFGHDTSKTSKVYTQQELKDAKDLVEQIKY